MFHRIIDIVSRCVEYCDGPFKTQQAAGIAPGRPKTYKLTAWRILLSADAVSCGCQKDRGNGHDCENDSHFI